MRATLYIAVRSGEVFWLECAGTGENLYRGVFHSVLRQDDGKLLDIKPSEADLAGLSITESLFIADQTTIWKGRIVDALYTSLQPDDQDVETCINLIRLRDKLCGAARNIALVRK